MNQFIKVSNKCFAWPNMPRGNITNFCWPSSRDGQPREFAIENGRTVVDALDCVILIISRES